MKKQPSISDIAKQLNVSVTTISFILNGKAEENRISEELTKRVLKYVGEIGYKPNQLAKSLRTGKTHILGLLVEDIANPFFANVAGEIEDIANKNGYRIFYCSSKNDTRKAKELLSVFEERQVDGYIITPVEGIENEIKSLIANDRKFILFDRYFPSLNTNYVVINNEEGGYIGANHLINQQYKKIGFITISSSQTQMQGRLAGYKKALKEHGLKQYIKKINFQEDHENMIAEIATFLEKEKSLDAVFFATNYLGVYGLEAIKKLGIKIPEQLAVLSFDDHDLFRLYTPSISVVAQPIKKMSEMLINVLLEQIDQKIVKNKKQIVVSAKLIVRESSRLS